MRGFFRSYPALQDIRFLSNDCTNCRENSIWSRVLDRLKSLLDLCPGLQWVAVVRSENLT